MLLNGDDLQVSHPMRVRGLKQALAVRYIGRLPIAPHAGAWIETLTSVGSTFTTESHPMRVRGLKLPICGSGIFYF